MSNKKQTFIDPKTGEEIESTRFARLVGGLVCGCLFGLLIAVIEIAFSKSGDFEVEVDEETTEQEITVGTRS